MAARLGERHHAAACTDHEVSLAIELVRVHGLSTREVAKKLEVAPRTVRSWLGRGSSARRALRRAS